MMVGVGFDECGRLRGPPADEGGLLSDGGELGANPSKPERMRRVEIDLWTDDATWPGPRPARRSVGGTANARLHSLEEALGSGDTGTDHMQ